MYLQADVLQAAEAEGDVLHVLEVPDLVSPEAGGWGRAKTSAVLQCCRLLQSRLQRSVNICRHSTSTNTKTQTRVLELVQPREAARSNNHK